MKLDKFGIWRRLMIGQKLIMKVNGFIVIEELKIFYVKFLVRLIWIIGVIYG